jgi:hypothetical protein
MPIPVRVAAIIGLATSLAGAARAADGVIEINQHCATQTGCGADSPGFPVQTQQGKSYVLTSSLAVTDADTTAVTLANGATLDLNGFSITGPAVCTGTPPSCLGLGTGDGVSTGEGATIRNGRIAGMGGDGVTGAAGTRVQNLLIEANGDDGVDASLGPRGWLVEDCRILRNRDEGVTFEGATPGGVVARNSIWGNGGFGILGGQLTIGENAIYGNGDAGWSVSGGAAVGYNALYGNDGAGPETVGSIIQTGVSICEYVQCL